MPTVTKRTFAVADGEVYPKYFEVGATVTGDLARVALEDGWATNEPGTQVAPPAIVAAAGEPAAAPSEPHKPAAGDETVSAPEAIPADWRSLSWPRLRSLASKLSSGPVPNKEEAIKAIAAAEAGQSQPAAA